MTKAMKTKAIAAINEYREQISSTMLVHDWGFHHYGEDYTIVETEDNKFNLYRVNRNSIYNDFVETFSI